MVVIGGESEVVPRHYYHSSISADLELSTVDVFDLTTRSWTSVATTVSPRKQPGSRAAETKPQVDDFPQRRSGATTSLKSHITHARTHATRCTQSHVRYQVMRRWCSRATVFSSAEEPTSPWSRTDASGCSTPAPTPVRFPSCTLAAYQLCESITTRTPRKFSKTVAMGGNRRRHAVPSAAIRVSDFSPFACSSYRPMIRH